MSVFPFFQGATDILNEIAGSPAKAILDILQLIHDVRVIICRQRPGESTLPALRFRFFAEKKRAAPDNEQ